MSLDKKIRKKLILTIIESEIRFEHCEKRFH